MNDEYDDTMTDDMFDLDADEYEKASTAGLVPPKNAKIVRSGTGKQWTELFRVVGTDLKGERNEAGDVIVRPSVRLEVDPESEGGNHGESLYHNMKWNRSALKRGEGKWFDKRDSLNYTMLCKLADIDPEDAASMQTALPRLMGLKVYGVIQKAPSKDGRMFDNVQSYIPYKESDESDESDG